MLDFPFFVRPSTPQCVSKPVNFTPELAFLLSLVIKDGLVHLTFHNMLSNIYPYVCEKDREAIRRLAQTEGFKLDCRPPRHDMNMVIDILICYAALPTKCLLQNIKKANALTKQMQSMASKMSCLNSPNAYQSVMKEMMEKYLHMRI